MTRRTLPILLTAVLAAVALSCAEPAAPSGGPVDITPPELQSAEPPLETLHFDADRVVLRFDEYIQLKDVFNQVLISPPMTEQPTFRLRGKSLIVDFEEDLLPDRTYVINFGEAIHDNNAGNVLRNFQYVFSTGALLDSLSLHGTVRHGENLKPAENLLVGLYETDDSAVHARPPVYFARTDESGAFRLNYLAGGEYTLFALDDKNFNYRYDLPNESVGFMDSVLWVDTVDRGYELLVSREVSTEQKILSFKSRRYGYVELALAGQAAEATFTFLPTTPLLREWNDSRDTLIIWLRDLTIDSLTVEARLDPSRDTVVVRRIGLRRIEDSVLREMELLVQANLPKVSGAKGGASRAPATTWPSFDLGRDLVLTWTSPIERVDTTGIRIHEIDPADSSEALFRTGIGFADSVRRHWRFEGTWMPRRRYRIDLPSGAFTDIYGLSHDSLSFTFQTRSAEDYGRMVLDFTGDSSSAYVLHLLDGSGRIVRRSPIREAGTNRLEFDHLRPGNYQLFLIEDRNRNGRWDPGSYARRSQPEAVRFFDEPVTVRGNWEMTFEWTLGELQEIDSQ